MKLAKITSAGQISLPAAVRRRWQTSRVVIDDLGDHLVVRPAPDDPVVAMRGIWKDSRISTDVLRRRARADEAAAQARRR